MELTRGQLTKLLMNAAEMGAERALAKTGILKPYLKKADAYRLYGRRNVDRWLKEHLITPRKDGEDSAAWRLDRTELEAVAKSSNRHTYLTTEERNITTT